MSFFAVFAKNKKPVFFFLLFHHIFGFVDTNATHCRMTNGLEIIKQGDELDRQSDGARKKNMISLFFFLYPQCTTGELSPA